MRLDSFFISLIVKRFPQSSYRPPVVTAPQPFILQK
jgi:hypothetical protein